MNQSHEHHTPSLPTTLEEYATALERAFHGGIEVADSTPPAVRFDQGWHAAGMEIIHRMTEAYGLSFQAYKHSNPEAEHDAGPFHHAQAFAYHTMALTILVHEMEHTPEEAILRFERLYYALSQQRAGVPGEMTTLFLYEPTGLCSGSPERTEHDQDCGCGSDHGGDTLEVIDSEILTHLRASYDRVRAADAHGDSPDHRFVPDSSTPVEPIG